MSEWKREPVQIRAEAMAHHLHKRMREAYLEEHAEKKAKGKGKDGQSYSSLVSRMGL